MFKNELDNLKKNGLLRIISDRQLSDNTLNTSARIHLGGKTYINFSSNDYLGLCSSPVLAGAAKKAIDEFPFGAGASRLLAGGTEYHRKLEEAIARLKGTEAAIVFNSGFQANASAIPALAGESDVIFSDELNHASIVDGCRLSRAKKVIYKHANPDNLASLMQKENCRRKIVVSDTVFSMDGDIAQIKQLYAICASMPDTILYLDDAHGTGVLGEGRGAIAHFNLKPVPWLIQMGTFSKALGSFGAFIAGTSEMIDWLINAARGFIFSTALPSCVVAASAASIEIIESDKSAVEKLWQNQRKAVEGITKTGYPIISRDTPIIAISVGDISETLTFSEKLKQRHIYAPAIRPPTVKTPRIRVTISAAHSEKDIEELISAFASLK